MDNVVPESFTSFSYLLKLDMNLWGFGEQDLESGRAVKDGFQLQIILPELLSAGVTRSISGTFYKTQ